MELVEFGSVEREFRACVVEPCPAPALLRGLGWGEHCHSSLEVSLFVCDEVAQDQVWVALHICESNQPKLFGRKIVHIPKMPRCFFFLVPKQYKIATVYLAFAFCQVF